MRYSGHIPKGSAKPRADARSGVRNAGRSLDYSKPDRHIREYLLEPSGDNAFSGLLLEHLQSSFYSPFRTLPLSFVPCQSDSVNCAAKSEWVPAWYLKRPSISRHIVSVGNRRIYKRQRGTETS